MSRKRRPGRVPGTRSTNAPNERNLIGPHEVFERIEKAGGVPDKVIDELGAAKQSPGAKQAGEQMLALTETVFESAKDLGAAEISVGDDPARRMAWSLSLVVSMKESAPRERWCRHIRAADPKVTEIRSVESLKAGIWYCMECLREAGPGALEANLWPTQCDLCGAQTETFNEFTRTIGGCMILGNMCRDCARFAGAEAAEAGS
jgi:rubrerythrin